MTQRQACKILGVDRDITEAELKKKYRKLMALTHPDAAKEHDYPYEANDINVAYEFLLQHMKDEDFREQKRAAQKEKQRMKWDAPVNSNAYAEREIYQYYEDNDGERVGIVTIDRGKYIWTPDEDFPLFLKSLYKLSKDIIIADDEKKGINRSENMELMADIAYLLAGQFFSAETTLSLMRAETMGDDGELIYYASAMLESVGNIKQQGGVKGAKLFPAYVRNHRLYVADNKQNVLGYLTFKDDRLLFGIVPLFERRSVQLKLESVGNSNNVHLWMKILPEDANSSSVDSLNIKINNILNKK